MNILDLDLDFFLNKVSAWGLTGSSERLPSDSYTPWSSEEVEEFLLHNCDLSKENKKPGKLLIHHDELYAEVKKLVQSGKTNKVNIDHVDAHADLGLGDLCYKYLFFNLLRKTVKKRYDHDPNIPDIQKMGPGNFLLYMIANRWIEELNYVHLSEECDDLNYIYFKNRSTSSGIIKLRVYCKNQIPADFNPDHDMQFMKDTNPCKFEKDVPLITTHYKAFISTKKYDYIFLTQSPSHTPIESDELIPIIMQYIDPL